MRPVNKNPDSQENTVLPDLSRKLCSSSINSRNISQEAEILNKMADMLGLNLFNVNLVNRHLPKDYYYGKITINKKEDYKVFFFYF